VALERRRWLGDRGGGVRLGRESFEQGDDAVGGILGEPVARREGGDRFT
jgi:hypothetical protein